MMSKNQPEINGAKSLLKKYNKLNLGCGNRPIENYLNADLYSEKSDIKIDFDKTPWPLPSNHFEYVYSYHVIEHLKDTQAVMDELWRICKPNARLHIILPHFSSIAMASPFHLKNFNSQSMQYFSIDDHPYDPNYGKANFKILKTRINWYGYDRQYINDRLHRKIIYYLSKPLDFLINLNRNFFERIWCYWVGGAFEVEWELEVVKKLQ